MALHRICVNEITSPTVPFTHDVTVSTAPITPDAPGNLTDAALAIYNECIAFSNPPVLSFGFDVALPYRYINQGVTFTGVSTSKGNTASITLTGDLQQCCNSTYSIQSLGSITSLSVTQNTVTGSANVIFTINNVCIQNSFTVSDASV